MDVKPLITRTEIDRTFSRLEQRLRAGAQKLCRKVGARGGNSTRNVYWRPVEGIWLCFTRHHANRYWCAYGTADPNTHTSLSITVEINPPKLDFDRRIGGLLVADGSDRVFLAHTGRIGGGRKGIGKDTFLDHYAGPTWATITWPDDVRSKIILLADVADERLAEQVAAFVREVELFKALPWAKISKPSITNHGYFTPEFEGRRRSFRLNTVVESVCNHGTVVRHLMTLLEARRFIVSNTRGRDLEVTTRRGALHALVEVKTSALTTDISTSIPALDNS